MKYSIISCLLAVLLLSCQNRKKGDRLSDDILVNEEPQKRDEVLEDTIRLTEDEKMLSLDDTIIWDSANESYKNDWVKIGLSGEVKSVKTYTAESDDYTGEVEKKDLKTDSYIEFNRDGYKTEKIIFDF